MQAFIDTRQNTDVLKGKICPYCGGIPVLVDSIKVYSKSYGNIWLCEPCQAWVGTHKKGSSDIPLGRLADADLRKAKRHAHTFFDNVWKKAMRLRGYHKHEARSKAYKWLSVQMRLDPKYTHIAMFDIDQCAEVVKHCAPYYRNKYNAPIIIGNNYSTKYGKEQLQCKLIDLDFFMAQITFENSTKKLWTNIDNLKPIKNETNT